MTDFWMYNPHTLVQCPTIVPLPSMTHSEKCNASTRLILVFTVFLMLIDARSAIVAGLIALFIVAAFHYIAEPRLQESYRPTPEQCDNVRLVASGLPQERPPLLTTTRSYTGRARTLAPPKLAPPIQSELWGNTRFPVYTRAGINRDKGFTYRPCASSSQCTPLKQGLVVNPAYLVDPTVEEDGPVCDPERIVHCGAQDTVEPFVLDTRSKQCSCSGSKQCSQCSPPCPGERKVDTVAYGIDVNVCAPTPGDMNDIAGYSVTTGLYGNLPNNQPVGERQVYPTLSTYNRNCTTQTLQPGYYVRTEIAEPQTSNAGIDYAQQFQPVQIDRETNTFVQRDPRLNCQTLVEETSLCPVPTNGNVFDPRSHGYGGSDRCYIDNVTGQPRWYYDDINSVRNSSHETYLQSGCNPASVAANMECTTHEAMNENFVDRTNTYRIDLQERLMRKNNEITRQRRMFPMRR